MKKQYIYPLIVFMMILNSCSTTRSIPSSITLNQLNCNQGTVVYEDLTNQNSNLISSIVSDPNYNLLNYGEEVYLIPDNGTPCYVSRDGIMDVMKPIDIEAIVYVDESFQGSNTYSQEASYINKILNKMNTGYSITCKEIVSVNLQDVNTGGRVNTDNLIRELKGRQAYDTSTELQIYLFNQSDFFNTANAITINLKQKGIQKNDQSLILGDSLLLRTPMLLVHELGHARGLTHSNEEEHHMFNVMHESNIGCVRGIKDRQLLIMHAEEYVGQIDHLLDANGNQIINTYYPNISESDCYCNYGQNDLLKSQVEMYINSFDRNIEDTPLIGDHLALIPYLDEIRNGNIDLSIIQALEENYKNESKFYLGTIDMNYVNQRLESNKKLRRNNILRWLDENRERSGMKDNNSIFDIGNNQASLDSLISDYVPNSLQTGCDECLVSEVVNELLTGTVDDICSFCEILKEPSIQDFCSNDCFDGEEGYRILSIDDRPSTEEIPQPDKPCSICLVYANNDYSTFCEEFCVEKEPNLESSGEIRNLINELKNRMPKKKTDKK